MKSAPFIGDGAGWEGWMEEESYIKYQEKGGKRTYTGNIRSSKTQSADTLIPPPALSNHLKKSDSKALV